MGPRDLLIQIGGAVALSTFFEIAYAAYNYITKKKSEAASPKPTYDTLFFPDSQIACTVHFTVPGGCTDKNCWYSHQATALMKLKESLEKAHCSLDICVYTITSQDLSELILNISKRGVCVRVITDDEQIDAAGSQVKIFRAAGIEVRHDDSTFFMHHKFAIVDGGLLINGSFNWSRQAIFGNNENLLITNDADIVTPYKREFEKLWDLYDPAKRQSTRTLRTASAAPGSGDLLKSDPFVDQLASTSSGTWANR